MHSKKNWGNKKSPLFINHSLYRLNQYVKAMEKTSKSGFTVLQIVDIPETFLRARVRKALSGRETFTDTDIDLNEQIFSGDVFENISSEYEELPKSSPLRKSLQKEDIEQIDSLAEELGNYELIRITKV